MRRCLSLPKDSLQIFPELAQLNEIILERFSGDGVAVVAHLLRAGLRASGLLEMSAQEDSASINRYCADAILDLARARLQYKAAHGQPAYREWMKPSAGKRKTIPLPGNAVTGLATQAAPVESGLASSIGVERAQSIGGPGSDIGDVAPSDVMQMPATVIQADIGAGFVVEEADQGLDSSAGADVLAQFRGNPLF